MFRIRPFSFISIFLILFLLLSCGEADGKKENIPLEERLPQITFGETDFDFGEADQNSQVEHIYKFKNTGTGDLLITNVRSTCGCSVPQWPKEPIPPGKDGQIKVVFKTGTYLNKVKKTLYVETNDPSNQKVPISIGGFVRAYIVVQPTNINFGKVDFQYPYKRKVQVFPDRAPEMKLKRITAMDNEFFEYTHKEIDHNGKKGIEIEVGLKGNYIGALNGRIIVELDDPKSPQISIPIQANVQPNISVNRSNISVRQKRGEFRAELLIITGDEKSSFKITGVKINNPNFKSKTVEFVPNRIYGILVWLETDKVKPGVYKDDMLVQTSDKKIPSFKIKLNYNILP